MLEIKAEKISIENAGYYRSSYKYSSISRLQKVGAMHGASRVIMFCILIAVLPTLLIIIPLYLRNIIFSDTIIPVAESDVIEITEGISSVFCQKHILKMNSSFNAFQLSSHPEIGNNRKHIRLKKSMILPDDKLEYWGFYLLKGAVVRLKVCSRFEGSRILVVRGQRNLQTCGLLEHNNKKTDAHLAKDYAQVQVIFETVAQEISDSEEAEQERRRKAEEVMNSAHEDLTEDDIRDVEENVKQFLESTSAPVKSSKRHPKRKKQQNRNETSETRHRRRHLERKQEHLDKIERVKREIVGGQFLDGRVQHGGNAGNHSESKPNESSMSSFETSLLNCYDGQILLTEGFDPSHLCDDVHYLDKADHLVAIHNVTSDGYYYYIFYSDNDRVSNSIHAVFDIYKPTYQYTNISESKQCINKTECSFPINFWSGETVIVEVPTRDGIEHEEDDITYLVSTCYPRMSVYVIFPVAVLFFILGCAFL